MYRRSREAPADEGQGDKVAHHTDWTDAQRFAIAEELNRILADPIFSGSKRCVTLLRSLIEHALTGNYDGMKERTLGVEVFGRDASYDAAADPIVRMTANEIRKRLAQWYQKSDHHHAVQFRLLPGTYYPEIEFDQHEDSLNPSVADAEVDPLNPLEFSQGGNLAQEVHGRASGISLRKWIFLITSILVLFAAIYGMFRSNHFRSTKYLVWKPLLDSQGTSIDCLLNDSFVPATNDVSQRQTSASVAVGADSPSRIDKIGPVATGVSFGDAVAATHVGVQLAKYGKLLTLRRSLQLEPWDLSGRPVVLIGRLDNTWAQYLLSNLRYKIRFNQSADEEWIEDAWAPSKREWTVDAAKTHDGLFVDYAVITRFWSQINRSWVISIAGLTFHGTRAASILISDDSASQLLPVSLRTARDFQIVLKTDVVGGSANPPQILAVYTW